jgi:galactokinase
MDELVRLRRVGAALERAGFDARDIGDRTSLVANVLTDFESRFGRRPVWAWWVPGRIGVFGKHTDYAGGRSLVAAVPRGFALAAAPRDDSRVVVRDSRWQATTEVRIAHERRRFSGWANYVAVVVRRLARDFPGAALGADIAFASDLPRAAGVSSSSALVVAIASVLSRRGALDRRDEWRQSIRGPLDLAGYLGAVENGLSFGAFDALGGVGTHGGSEDHTAILNSRPGSVSAFRYVPVQAIGVAAVPPDWRFVVMSSGVEASKAGAVKDRYNALSLATRGLVDVWRRLEPGTPGGATLGAILERDAGAADRLRDAVLASSGSDREQLTSRLAHFVAEDGRVPLALNAFGEADVAAVGELSAASQADAASTLRNQVPETSALVEIARETGAFAATSFGAGFGGSVWALADADEADRFAGRWLETYLTKCPERRQASAFVARPAPAAMEIVLDSD